MIKQLTRVEDCKIKIDSQKEKPRKNPIHINHTQKIEINLTKEIKDLYNKTSTIIEEMEDTKMYILCSRVGRTNIIKMSILD